MGLLLLKYVFIGFLVVVCGLFLYEFVIVVVFMCMNLGYYQFVGYGIVEMEDVSVGIEIIYKFVYGQYLLFYL